MGILLRETTSKSTVLIALQNVINIWAELIPLVPCSVFIKLMYVVRNGTGYLPSTLLTYLKVRRSPFSNLSIHMQIMHTKVRRKLLPNIIYSRKRSWKGNAAVQENERNQGNHFVQKCSHKQCRVCHNQPRIWCPICKFDFCMEPCFKAFHMSYFVKV